MNYDKIYTVGIAIDRDFLKFHDVTSQSASFVRENVLDLA